MQAGINTSGSSPRLGNPSSPSSDYGTMCDFVRDQGGRVRFDTYAREHLFGATGFYAERLDIARANSGVPTPCKNNVEYRSSLVMMALCHSANYCRQNREALTARPLQFCEIGGGNGAFKEDFTRAWNQHAVPQGFPGMHFTSVDINPTHRKYQQAKGGTVIAGTATATTLSSDSMDIVFDEEVLDCLPFRLLSWDKDRREISAEAFVQLRDGALQLIHEAPQREERFLQHIERYLREKDYSLPFYRFAMGHWDYLAESSRILRSGGIRLSADYTADFLGPLIERTLMDIEKVISSPYQHDLTHGVDFHRLWDLSRHHGFQGYIRPLENEFRSLPGEGLEEALVHAMGRAVFAAKKL